jgi:serine/threonine-protein kinase
VCKIALQVCRALKATHAAGVVHRDLKPSNIVLCRDADEDEGADFVKVVDFGLVKVVDRAPGEESVDITRAGALLGSPSYMSPEQVRAEPVDARTDVYAVGVLLFHMLAGKPPFTASIGVELMNQHLLEPVPSIRSVIGPDRDFAPELEVILRRAMEKDRNDRHASMAELADELKAALRLIKEPPPPAEPAPIEAPPMIPEPELSAGFIGGVVAAAIVVFLAIVLSF